MQMAQLVRISHEVNRRDPIAAHLEADDRDRHLADMTDQTEAAAHAGDREGHVVRGL